MIDIQLGLETKRQYAARMEVHRPRAISFRLGIAVFWKRFDAQNHPPGQSRHGGSSAGHRDEKKKKENRSCDLLLIIFKSVCARVNS
jgi:hypothetical protein